MVVLALWLVVVGIEEDGENSDLLCWSRVSLELSYDLILIIYIYSNLCVFVISFFAMSHNYLSSMYVII